MTDLLTEQPANEMFNLFQFLDKSIRDLSVEMWYTKDNLIRDLSVERDYNEK
jgi:hypothetical protein